MSLQFTFEITKSKNVNLYRSYIYFERGKNTKKFFRHGSGKKRKLMLNLAVRYHVGLL